MKKNEEGKPKDPDLPVCHLCNKSVAAKGSNTSNLLSHLHFRHPLKYTEVENERKTKSKPLTSNVTQPTIVDTVHKTKKYKGNGKKWKQLTDSTTFRLAKDMLPIYTVEKVSFKKLFNTMEPQYELSSRKYFSQTAFPALYLATKERICQQLKCAQYFSSTTYPWSSSTSEPYMSYTVHYLDIDWSLQTRCIQTLYVPKNHTAMNLSAVMTQTLQSWNLEPSKQVYITTDNGSNLIKRCSDLHWMRMPYFGHNLHLATNNSIKDDLRVSRALGLCRKLVGTFTHSWKKKRDLTEAQQQQSAICQVLSADRKCSHLIYSWQDLDVLESLKAALGSLAVFTDMLSGDEKVNLSTLDTFLHILITQVLSESSDDTSPTADIKMKILHYLQAKYSDSITCKLLNITSYLDPQFMVSYIHKDM